MYQFGDIRRVSDNHWLETTKEFYRWKKTPEYEKWKRKQFLRQGGLCWYCAVFLPMTKVNVEHKTARSRGGRNNRRNLVLACSACNREKGSKPLSAKRRKKLNDQNKNSGGTYLKNKALYEKVYKPYSDDSLGDLFRSF